MMRTTLSVLAILFVALTVTAQKDAVVKFLIDPGHEYKVKVDNDTIWNKHYLNLKEGNHDFVIWSPGYHLLDTTLTLVSGDTLVVYRKLKETNEYLAFVEEYEQKVASYNRIQTPAILINIVAIGYAGYRYGKKEKIYDQLEELHEVYEQSSWSAFVEQTSEEFELTKEDYIDQRKKYRTSIGILGLSAAYTVLSSRLASKNRLPVFNDKARLEFETLSFIPMDQGYDSNPYSLVAGIKLHF